MRYDTIVVGAGPAGLAAARAARRSGNTTLVLDDNWGPGGQIWRGREGLDVDGVELQFSRQLEDVPSDAGQVILATGARELFLPFPGWTLPHVVGAGGLQALVKQGLNVRGKRVVVAGSGPLLLAVAANLSKAGAAVVLVAEQTPWEKVARFAMQLWRWPSKVFEGLRLGSSKYRAGLWPVEAVSGGVVMSDGVRYECDYLACGFGLVPNLELPMLAGCAIENGFVKVNRHQQTSVQCVYAVGELTGIGGVEKAEAEGEAAGSGKVVRGDHGLFVRMLADTFQLREELRKLARPETIVCRCEDVPLSRLGGCLNKREAKLQTRCGMGPCQGRVCGPALEFLYGWPADRVRPPAFPVTVRRLIDG